MADTDFLKFRQGILDSSEFTPGQKLRLLELLEGASTKYDSITGLETKNSLEKRLREEISRAKRHYHPLSIIMLSIDYFPQYVETYGNQQGRLVLMQIADILKTNKREEDIVGKYNDEGFLLILPVTNGEGANNVAEHVKELIGSAEFGQYIGKQESINRQYTKNRRFHQITTRIGVVPYPLTIDDSVGVVIDKAITALEQATKLGGNGIVVYHPPT